MGIKNCLTRFNNKLAYNQCLWDGKSLKKGKVISCYILNINEFQESLEYFF